MCTEHVDEATTQLEFLLCEANFKLSIVLVLSL